MSNKANALIHESSPYLLQHAHNPVNWIPWSDDLFERAENENKPILFSIGYSSCHWCHVMEHESFEDEEVAKIMNEHFICVKIDREERPDIDQAYMDAVVLLTQRGGWPLNCFTLPDGRPIYGGTYFPKAQWKQALEAVHREFTTNLDELESFAENLTKGIIQKNSIGVNPLPAAFNNDILEVMSTRWKRMFDKIDGGLDHAPKFPMPNNYQFMLKEGWMNHDNELVNHSIFTLKKMQQGGIYDQVEGGFSRYSVDGYWRVPHFEKMLYDNAQLIEVYAEAYQVEENEEFRTTILDTIAFCKNDLSNKQGLYYSALDADSDGAEGAYYTYSLEEFETAAGENKELMKAYFRVDQEGYWEDGRNILLRKQSKADFCAAQGLSQDEFEQKLQALLSELRVLRSNRSKPGLDHKALVSWNSMMTSALCKASEALGDDNILADAIQTGELIAELVHSENKLLHSFGNDKGQGRVEAYLEDYAFAIRAFVDLFKASADPKHLEMAKRLCDQTIAQFYSEQKEMFYFTSDRSKTALHRRLDAEDGVIPSSNSAMANNLIDLNHLLNEDRYYDIAKKMLHRIEPKMTEYPPNYSNWAQAYQKLVYPFYEVAIVGPKALEMKKELQKHYLPNAMVVCSTTESDLPLFEYRFKEGETRIFVCVNQQCQQPSSSIDEALKMII